MSAGNFIRLTTVLTIFPSYYTNKLLQVKKRLEEKKILCAIPTMNTVRYQFAPPHARYKTSFKYKSKFDVVSKIQRRQSCKCHEDAHYVNAYQIMSMLIMSMPRATDNITLLKY